MAATACSVAFIIKGGALTYSRLEGEHAHQRGGDQMKAV